MRPGARRGAHHDPGGRGRLPSDSITGLKGKWHNYTDNKRDPYAELTDYYY